MSKGRLYIAYGSNLNKEQMAYRCPGAVPAGTAALYNTRLLFKGLGSGYYLTIEPAAGFSVPVALWKTDEEHEESLDRYEGFPFFYRKDELEIAYTDTEGNEKTSPAYVYVMREGCEPGEPSDRYFSTCLQGYADFGFDPALLYEAREKSAETEE